MFRSLLCVAAALSLAACGPLVSVTPPQSGGSTAVDQAADAVALAAEKLDHAWRAYVEVRRVAELVVPFLSTERAAKVRAIEAKVEAAFARARATADLAQQAIELARAASAAAQLEEMTVDRD